MREIKPRVETETLERNYTKNTFLSGFPHRQELSPNTCLFEVEKR